jgi:hypothetical protein
MENKSDTTRFTEPITTIKKADGSLIIQKDGKVITLRGKEKEIYLKKEKERIDKLLNG